MSRINDTDGILIIKTTNDDNDKENYDYYPKNNYKRIKNLDVRSIHSTVTQEYFNVCLELDGEDGS